MKKVIFRDSMDPTRFLHPIRFTQSKKRVLCEVMWNHPHTGIFGGRVALPAHLFEPKFPSPSQKETSQRIGFVRIA